MGRIIASCSFGKDSIAAILVALGNGIKIDEIVYCRVMYSDTISAEFPSHEKFIHEVAIPYFEREHNLKTTIIQSETYKGRFYRKKIRGKNKDKIYGFPSAIGAWCNSELKMKAIKKISSKNCKEIVGIAYDEPKRIPKQVKKGNILPLVDYGITEAMAFDICREKGLLSPAYEEMQTTRLGCWFCHNTRMKILKIMRKKYPDLWKELLTIQRDSPFSFKLKQSIFDLENIFQKEDEEIQYTQLKIDF